MMTIELGRGFRVTLACREHGEADAILWQKTEQILTVAALEVKDADTAAHVVSRLASELAQVVRSLRRSVPVFADVLSRRLTHE